MLQSVVRLDPSLIDNANPADKLFFHQVLQALRLAPRNRQALTVHGVPDISHLQKAVDVGIEFLNTQWSMEADVYSMVCHM